MGVAADFLVAVGPAAHDYLGTAEIVAVGVVDDVYALVYAVLEVGAEFEEARGAYGQDAVDGDSDAGLEVGVVAVVGDHIERDGAVGKEEVAAGYAGQVNLEAGLTVLLAHYGHRQHCGNISFAGCSNTFGVQHRKRQAAGIMNGRQQIETTYRQAIQTMFSHQGLKVTVYAPDGSVVNSQTITDGAPGKIFLADSLGNAVFINRLKFLLPEDIERLNAILAAHPMCPVLIDNGRYYQYSVKNGSYREYIRQDLFHPDSCHFVVGSISRQK